MRYIYLMRYISSSQMHNKIKAIEIIKDIQRIFWGSARRAPLVGGIIPGNVDISLSPGEEPYDAGGGKSRRRHSRSHRRFSIKYKSGKKHCKKSRKVRKMRHSRHRRGSNKKSRKVRKIRKSRRRSQRRHPLT